METTEFIWCNGELIPWEAATTHVLSHTLHYGGGVFEGIRVYAAERGPAIFRLGEHLDRLFYSAGALHMASGFTAEQLTHATVELVRRNKLAKGYVRPLMYYGYGKMGVNPKGAPVQTIIACWPWGAYLPHEMIDVKVSKYIRIHPRSTVADAKICGHYVNSILAVLDLDGTKYHEALFLDFNGNVAEGPGENLFIVRNGQIQTPKLGTILAGITRRTIIEIARDKGLEVVERDLTLPEVLSAEEAFFTGTAAEVTPIRSIDDQPLGNGILGPVAKLIRDTYQDVVHGRVEKYQPYLTYCS